jgi:anti-sigma-K factor RskA
MPPLPASVFDPDDPRWGEFVLGDLDADEQASLERLLAESAAAREHVRTLRLTVEQLAAALRTEPASGLEVEQRQTIACAGVDSHRATSAPCADDPRVENSAATLPSRSRRRRLLTMICGAGVLAVAASLLWFAVATWLAGHHAAPGHRDRGDEEILGPIPDSVSPTTTHGDATK